MSKKSNQDYEQLYLNLRKDYNSLLEKNQNDLVKIRVREKTLNEKIQQIQKQRQEQVLALKEQIQNLKTSLNKALSLQNNQNSTKKQPQVAYSKENFVKKEQEYKIMQTLYKKESQTCSQLKNQIGEIQRKFNQLEENYKKEILIVKNQQQQKQQLTSSQNQNLKNEIVELQNTLCQARQQFELSIIQMQTKYRGQIMQKQQACNRLRYLIEQEKGKVKHCESCSQLNQQLQLQKEMLKSVRMMLKFKEMELQSIQKS